MPFAPKPPHPAPGAALPASAVPEAGTYTWGTVIYGAPIAKKRPRFARRGTFVATYNDQQAEEGRLYLDLKQAWGQREPLFGPLVVELTFGMPIPSSSSTKKRLAMLKGEMRHTKKSDLDNLCKFILDVGNGLLWVDDSQIFQIKAAKEYADPPYTRIAVMSQ